MIHVQEVKIPVNEPQDIKRYLAKKLGMKEAAIFSFQIRKQSLDARNKAKIYYVYDLLVDTPLAKEVVKRHKASYYKEETYSFPKSDTKIFTHRPVIVGSGPAGLFAAYLLAEHGYRPLIIERGEEIGKRIKTVEHFFSTGKLNEESNVQFGEGGAGTFSDGKLGTMVKDKKHRGQKVFSTFVKHGAPEEILFLQKPHIGTDKLCQVIKNMREEIIRLGGTFQYQTKLTNVILDQGKLTAIEVNKTQIIPCEVLILAIGHSARDTIRMLYDAGVKMEGKPFAVGLRISHPQVMMNKAQYGSFASLLPPASYKLTYQSKNKRGVYTFCMCPGGYVVNASSEKGRLVVNGMSNHNRDSTNANSAVVVTVGPKDYGDHPFAGLVFQEQLEEKAYQLAQGKIPLQLWEDFQENRPSTAFGEVEPELKGAYQFANLREILPAYLEEAFLEAIPAMEKKIKGFARPDALLAGVESRTSSPVRLIRDEKGMTNLEGIYVCGEGSGYAGGITTSAMDGIKIAEAIAEQFEK